jgi:Ca-activated chloride channel homolog
VRAMTDTKRWAVTLLSSATLLIAGAGPAVAQGWIEPGVDRGGFAVDKVRSEVAVRVQGRVALIEVSEWFVNEGRRLAEGEYLYPLPGEAVFQGFSLFQGETELRGEIMDADRAREIYEAIVRRRADPALIELAGQGLLRARVFPIQPGETRKVTLRYTQVLERAGDALQLAYVGGVRGGAQAGAGEVRRAPRTGVRTKFEVVVEDCDSFLDPFSPTHTLDFDRDGDRMIVSVDDEVTGRLALFLPLAGDAVGLSVATHRPVGEDGYFMLTLSPDRVSGAVQPRDVTVVMDVSGSMSGEKIEQAREALHQLLGSLSRGDRFRLLSFSSAVRAFDRDWTDARGRDLDRARSWIDDLVADGGTNIEAALREAFRLESQRGRLPVVVFLTDGLPSVGEQSPDALTLIAESSADRARVFAFGVGHDVNTQLLDRLGEAGRGDTDYVQPGESVERALSLLAAKIQHPVLTELELSGGPIEIDEVYPVRIPDVFAGEELVLFGRFSGDGQSQVTVSGERLGRALEFSTESVFPDASDANDYIPRLWASRKLGHLERQVWTEGMTESLAREIRDVALRYGLPSRYTAYLVEEPNTVVAAPVDLDGRGGGFVRGLANRSSGGAGGAPAAPTSGADAVQAAESARRMRTMATTAELESAADDIMAKALAVPSSSVPRQALGGRIFELRGETWTDIAARDDAPVVEVRAYSAAWFDLMRALPELEAVLRTHENVVIGGGELTLRIGADGADRFDSDEVEEVVRDFRGSAAG